MPSNESEKINITAYKSSNYDLGTHPDRPNQLLMQTKDLPDAVQSFAFSALEEKAKILKSMGIRVLDTTGKEYATIVAVDDNGEQKKHSGTVNIPRGFVFELPTASSRRDFEKIMKINLKPLEENLGSPLPEAGRAH